MERLGIGVIGASNFGKRHMESITQGKNAKLVAVCDVIEELARDAAEEYRAEFYCTDYHDVLKRDDIDAVTLPLPDQVHCQIAIDALRAGKHVLCEKPMALDIEECKEMIKVAKETGKQLMVGQVGRYTPAFVKAKELIDAGEIGELFFVESEYAHDYSKIGGVGGWRVTPERHPVLGGGCHAMDLLRTIAGDPYEAVAYANNKVLTDWPINDFTVGILKFPNNVIGKIMTSVGCKRKYTMRTVLYGTKGTIVCDNTSNTITIFKEKIESSETMYGEEWQDIEIKIPISVNNHNTVAEIDDFCECVRYGKPVRTDGIQGASTVKACLALVESAKTGQPVKIEYDFD